jgi:hypothetical protein
MWVNCPVEPRKAQRVAPSMTANMAAALSKLS